MTPADIAQYLWDYLDLDAQDLAQTLVTQWAAEGQRQVLAARPHWKHLESTSTFDTIADEPTYTGALGDLKTITAVDCPEYGPLSVVDRSDAVVFFRTAAGTTRTGRPQAISVYADEIMVWPTPDRGTDPTDTDPIAGYTINLLGYRPPTAVTAATDTIDVPEGLTDAVIEWCFQKAYLQQDDPEMSAVHAQLFAATLQRLGDREDDDTDASPLIFGGGVFQNRQSSVTDYRLWADGIGLV